MKLGRFGKTEFQERLARARRFQRKTRARPETRREAFLWKIGFQSKLIRYAAALVLAVLVYFLAISQLFLVKNVALAEGAITTQQVSDVLSRMQKTRIAKIIPSNHILVLTKRNFLTALQRDMPQIREISSFRKRYPNTVDLVLETRTPQYVWQSGSDFYSLDQDAVVFQRLANYSAEAYPETLIVDRTGGSVSVGQTLEPTRIFQFIDAIKNKWTENVAQTNYVSFSVPGIESLDVFAKTVLGFEAYFDVERNPERQLQNLALVLGREIQPETYTGLSYVDLRLSDTAYYCYKDAPCAPEYQP